MRYVRAGSYKPACDLQVKCGLKRAVPVVLHVRTWFFVGLLPSTRIAACGAGVVKGECRSLSRMLLANARPRLLASVGRVALLSPPGTTTHLPPPLHPHKTAPFTFQLHPHRSDCCQHKYCASTTFAVRRHVRHQPELPLSTTPAEQPILSCPQRYVSLSAAPVHATELTEPFRSPFIFTSHVGPQAQSR